LSFDIDPYTITTISWPPLISHLFPGLLDLQTFVHSLARYVGKKKTSKLAFNMPLQKEVTGVKGLPTSGHIINLTVHDVLPSRTLYCLAELSTG